MIFKIPIISLRIGKITINSWMMPLASWLRKGGKIGGFIAATLESLFLPNRKRKLTIIGHILLLFATPYLLTKTSSTFDFIQSFQHALNVLGSNRLINTGEKFVNTIIDQTTFLQSIIPPQIIVGFMVLVVFSAICNLLPGFIRWSLEDSDDKPFGVRQIIESIAPGSNAYNKRTDSPLISPKAPLPYHHHQENLLILPYKRKKRVF